MKLIDQLLQENEELKKKTEELEELLQLLQVKEEGEEAEEQPLEQVEELKFHFKLYFQPILPDSNRTIFRIPVSSLLLLKWVVPLRWELACTDLLKDLLDPCLTAIGVTDLDVCTTAEDITPLRTNIVNSPTTNSYLTVHTYIYRIFITLFLWWYLFTPMKRHFERFDV